MLYNEKKKKEREKNTAFSKWIIFLRVFNAIEATFYIFSDANDFRDETIARIQKKWNKFEHKNS